MELFFPFRHHDRAGRASPMKNPTSRFFGGWRASALALLVSSCCLACSGEDPAPVQSNPQATETNFKTLPCRTDADCGEGGRCVDAPAESEPADAGAGRCMAR